jgi:hypothetical protein
MIPTGIILAVLDCDADSIEEWNRWYDLEHTPPNVMLPGVMLSHRYVATPELHAARMVHPESPLANQRGTFLTIYMLCDDPATTIAAMTALRDKLYAEGRMNFPPEKKAVRDGDAMRIAAATSAPRLRLPPEEVPFLGHTGILLVQRTASPDVDEWYEREWAPGVARLEGVHGVVTFRSSRQADGSTDIVLFEGDAVDRTKVIRANAPHYPDAKVSVEAPFLLIEFLHYPWADAIRASTLPRTVS